VVVAEKPRLSLTINKNSFSEASGAGIALLTISRPVEFANSSLIVQLRSSDTTEAALPSSATLASGATSVVVGVNAIDDALFDGSQIVELSASSDLFQTGRLSVTVTDYQPVTLVAQSNTLHEDIPSQRSTQLTVSIRSPAPAGGARVSLTANPTGILSFPAMATVPEGSTQVAVTVSAIDDLRPQRERRVTLEATGANLIGSTVLFTVNDSDPFRWTNPTLPYDVNNDRSVDPLDVLALINEINRSGSRFLDPVMDVSPPYYDPNPDGSIDPLDVLAVINEINRRK
jgi:hypothetical protein